MFLTDVYDTLATKTFLKPGSEPHILVLLMNTTQKQHIRIRCNDVQDTLATETLLKPGLEANILNMLGIHKRAS